MTNDADWRAAFAEHLAHTSPEPLGVAVARAEGPWIYTPAGERYLDLLSGIGVANLGHTHPAVVEAVERQNRLYHHVMVYGEYVQQEQALYARELASVLPDPIDRIYFVSSGAEAIEGAIKTARKATGRPGFVAFDGAYHGDTLGALSLAGNAAYRDPFEPLPGPVRRLPFGDESALAAIDETIAAVVIEPIQGEGGVRVPPDGFLPALAERARRVGALLIFDEVMTGFGRTGRLFALEHEGVVPDILVLAKALGGGYPLGAFAARSDLLATLTHDPPLAHVTTFGGHPVSCAAGRAALAVLRDQRLPERADRVGSLFAGALCDAMGTHGTVKEIRGRGLFIGIELDSAELTRRFTTACRGAGILLGWTLHHDQVLRLAPPLVTPENVLVDAARRMGEILTRVEPA